LPLFLTATVIAQPVVVEHSRRLAAGSTFAVAKEQRQRSDCKITLLCSFARNSAFAAAAVALQCVNVPSAKLQRPTLRRKSRFARDDAPVYSTIATQLP
jgi:hypothetical protein